MGYRNILVENEASLSLKNNQLVVTKEEAHTIPVEDINSVLIESRRVNISSALMSFLAQRGVALFICDEKHLPCAVLTPFMQHSRQLKIVDAQMQMKLPEKKKIWKEIVCSKIANQAMVLELSGDANTAERLRGIAKTVKSGDSDNAEATAAMLYFPKLFGEQFTRGNDMDLRNSCLNYGYAIIRGQIARLLSSYGFLTCLGVNHHSQLNSFNLADDAMEPFRPLVDLFVVTNIGEQENELTPPLKRKIFNLLSYDMEIDGKNYAMSYAAEILVQSLSSRILGQTEILKMPRVRDLRTHKYE